MVVNEQRLKRYQAGQEASQEAPALVESQPTSLRGRPGRPRRRPAPRIFSTHGTFFVEDLASRNGSTLNGRPIISTTALSPGDRLQCGATTMEFS